VVQAIRHHPVSRPRSSNAACGFPALRSPTGFTAKHTTRPVIAREWAADAVFALRQSSFRWFLALQVFCRLSPITMPSPSSEAHQKSGPFPPPALPGLNSTMALSDTRRHRCLFATLRPRPSCRTGLRRLPAPPFQRAVPSTPADRMGACVDYFPIHAAFPVIQAGRRPQLHFRGLLRLHSRYGPLDCSTAQGGLCHEASARPVTRQSRSSATGAIDNFPDGSFLHWWCAPSARTE
jgi:hypothetical protein